MKDLTTDEIKEILTLAYDFGFKGFGGECAAAAIAINRVLFQGRGKFVIAVNDALWAARKHFAGHVVVEFGGIYWDADARPKSIDDINDWGDLSGDIYYKAVAKDYGIRWTKKRSQETVLFELDSEAELPFGHDNSEELTSILNKALDSFLAKRNSRASS